ncbi:MAG: hypothetical protein V4805_18340 [Pseudomonadota bacterium]
MGSSQSSAIGRFFRRIPMEKSFVANFSKLSVLPGYKQNQGGHIENMQLLERCRTEKMSVLGFYKRPKVKQQNLWLNRIRHFHPDFQLSFQGVNRRLFLILSHFGGCLI